MTVDAYICIEFKILYKQTIDYHMKKLFAIIMTVMILASCSTTPESKNQMTISGTISGDYSGMVDLYKRTDGDWVKLDSVKVDNGSFVLSAQLEYPEMYYLGIEGQNRFAGFFAEPSDITIETSVDDFRNLKVSGSASQTEYEAYNDKIQLFNDMYSDLNTQYKAAKQDNDEEKLAQLEIEYESVDEQMKQFIIDNALSNPKSIIAAYAVNRNAYYFDENDLEPVVNNFDESIKGSTYVEGLVERLETLKRVAVGQPAIDFTMDDMNGEPVALSSLFGNYLLVDFWASWCGPCRQENPNVVEAYNKFHDKGFDVLGVSFDKTKDKWIEAVENDGLTWHHVSDLQYWGNAAGKLYGINSIPANVLLDPEGKIIAKNLRGEDLQNKLAELLN